MSATKPHALVTGASRGIGAAIARALASAGFPVIINYRERREPAQEVATAIAEAGGTAELCPFDVRDAQACEAALTELLTSRTIGVIVNNAGIVRDGPFPSMEREAWESVTRTTLDGFYNVTRPLVMPMVRARWGRIINITSVSGLIGVRGQANYSAAKAGLIGATRSLAQELAKRKITVNAVAPGLIETEMIAEVQREHVLERIPARRLGRPEEVAALVRFLASDEAAYITGQVIGINGGLA
ncbi:3-oxoacyl-ACP reductase FabG [Paraliomyxa miuraensis]|uniref:3-oxoacyl-ACP reductase FabG n=1 Tax=Paraliomyxa miuraensis TaxID=376150 RepID=UPI002259D836|nr:3-oxoacyl-ACP reductase FabG [Paraliomyxa miuraensis]MCX4247039.1 3-oxoacyl-ACP reductase FabG [Paraliomyxa miuraensis]